MNLQDNPFIRIKSGLKTIEMRLNDEKRQNLKINDKIEFTNIDTGEVITCSITGLYPYKSFKILYKIFDKTAIGYGIDEKANPADMYSYYTKDQEKKYGVLGIGLSLDEVESIELKDDEFPKILPVNFNRRIARAFVLDEFNNVAIHVINREDKFGTGLYYETPGGGIDEGESSFDAIKRECSEELGYEVEVIEKVSHIDDYYNILRRRNIQDYYLCKRKEFVGKHLVSFGDSMIKDTLWVPVDKALELYKEGMHSKIGRLVSRREMIPLLKIKKYLEENHEN